MMRSFIVEVLSFFVVLKKTRVEYMAVPQKAKDMNTRSGPLLSGADECRCVLFREPVFSARQSLVWFIAEKNPPDPGLSILELLSFSTLIFAREKNPVTAMIRNVDTMKYRHFFPKDAVIR